MTTYLLYRRSFWKSLLASVALLVATGALQAQQKIAIVNLSQVFTNYYKTKQADSILQESGSASQKYLKERYDEYGKANEDYKKLVEGANDQAVAADEREKRRKAADSTMGKIKDLEKEIQQFRAQAETRIAEQKSRMRERILGELLEAINAKAKIGSYNFVFDVSGYSANNGTPLLIFSDGQNDITEALIKELNANAPPGILNADAKEEKPAINPPKLDEKPSPPITAPATKNKKK